MELLRFNLQCFLG